MKIFFFWLIAFLWGGSFIAIKEVVQTVPPFWAASIRLMTALVFLLPYMKLLKKNFSIARPVWGNVVLSGLCSQGIPFALLFWGEQTVSPGLGGILNGTTPIWTFIFGMIFLRHHEPFTQKKLVGLILGITGIFIIFFPKLQNGLGNSSTLGAIAVGIMGLSYGLGNITNKAVMVHADHPTLEGSLFWQSITSTVFVTILAFIFEGLPSAAWFHNIKFIGATLYMGWCSTAIAFIIYYKLINEMGALKASAVIYLIPLTAVLLDFLFYQNIPTSFELIGAGVMLTAIFIIQDRKFKVG